MNGRTRERRALLQMGQLYDLDGNGWWVFLLVTCLLGGAGSFVSGRAMAQTWRPYWQVPLYMLAMAAGIRFIHHALFDEVLLSLKNFAVDFGVAVIAASAGYRLVRADQIASQYGWLFERAGPFGWRRKS